MSTSTPPTAEAPTVARFSFRPLLEADLPLLHGWLARPHWTAWWGPAPSLAEVHAEYGPWIAAPDAVRHHIALLEGQPFGYIQSYRVKDAGGGWWENETDPGARGIDQSIANLEDLGRGLGTAMVEAFVATVFRDPQVSHIQTDPHPDNTRATRAQRGSFPIPRRRAWSSIGGQDTQRPLPPFSRAGGRLHAPAPRQPRKDTLHAQTVLPRRRRRHPGPAQRLCHRTGHRRHGFFHQQHRQRQRR
jgi:RimJ/RimL family protein N-acetyltransferase